MRYIVVGEYTDTGCHNGVEKVDGGGELSRKRLGSKCCNIFFFSPVGSLSSDGLRICVCLCIALA